MSGASAALSIKQHRRKPDWARQGVLFGLATTFAEANPEWLEGRPEYPELRLQLALVKTTFARFPRQLCQQLIYRGWWLTGASISTYHPHLLSTLPDWRPLPHDQLNI